MLWPILLIVLLLVLGTILFWQRFTISKKENLDHVLFNLRALHAQALLQLADNLLENVIPSEEENLEFRKFIAITDNTIQHFDTIKKEYLNFKSYKHLFLNIDNSFKTIEHEYLEYNQRTFELKKKFVENLQLAFHSIPLFRFRLIAMLVVCIVRALTAIMGVLAIIGLKKLTNQISKFSHIVQTYSSLRKSMNDDLCY